MTREELEHIIRASGDITDQYEFVIVGSQSMLGPVPNPEAVFTVSMEADIYPLQAPELADEIDGAIGEGSQFHQSYGYYARGVQHPVQRGVFWQRSARHGLLFANGFKPRIATYDGFEVPVPLAITIQHGDGDLVQVAKDILGLTKLNYNSCQLGEGQPITVKYSDRVGEILLANPGLPPDKWKHNFKYYA